jgi:hypothetical protein
MNRPTARYHASAVQTEEAERENVPFENRQFVERPNQIIQNEEDNVHYK